MPKDYQIIKRHNLVEKVAKNMKKKFTNSQYNFKMLILIKSTEM